MKRARIEDSDRIFWNLIRDRDGIYGEIFRRKVSALGLQDVVTPRASPWCNGFAERVIGTIRRECTDRIIPMGERHLLRVLREFVDDYKRGTMPPVAGWEVARPATKTASE